MVLLERVVNGRALASDLLTVLLVPLLAEVVRIREHSHEADQTVQLSNAVLHKRKVGWLSWVVSFGLLYHWVVSFRPLYHCRN
jgi:hypothetical protein